MKTVRRCVLPVLALAGLTLSAATAFVHAAAADPGDPASGAFVIGDGNYAQGSAVTFWGAQWWKDNEVSGGDAPASFKGYALNFDAASCTFTTTSSFSTRTGNSPPPPDGPLPPTITVLVTSGVTQDGSTISGTVLGTAVVATDDGYSSDPGHPGTGTVLSFTACGPVF